MIQVLFLPVPVVEAEAARWSTEQLPLEGQAGKWGLAAGSDAQYLTMAPDGTLYCYATPSGATDTFYKSTDGGISWSYTGRVRDVIVDIAVCPQDANTVYYATVSKVCKSTDAGISFTTLPLSPGGSGAGNIQITSIDIVRIATGNLVVVSTRDTDAGQFGGVYLLDESVSPPAWVDTGIGSYDITCVAFSPVYATDRTITAVKTDETNTIVSFKVAGGGWGAGIGDATIPGIVTSGAAIGFPDDHAVTGSFYTGITTGTNTGDVYRIDRGLIPAASSATDLNSGAADTLPAVDICSLAVNGNTAGAIILAGRASSAQIYKSPDGGATWAGSRKPPTGQSRVYVAIAPNYPTQQKVYAATTGTESAFSISNDGGAIWNQTGLVDCKITTIVDIGMTWGPSVYPAFFMLTFNSTSAEHSIWRRTDAGSPWQRVFCGNLPAVDGINYIACSPIYGSRTLYLAGDGGGSPVLWQSTDNGQTFTQRAAPSAVNTLTLLDDNTLFVSGYVGGKGVIYRSDNGGAAFSPAVEASTKSLWSLCLSPNFSQDKTILAGNISGQVYWSQNGGVSFEQIGQQLPLTALIGKVSVVFDKDFTANKTIYASTDAKVTTTSKDRIFRFVLGQSSQWQNIYGGLPEKALVTWLLAPSKGGFYAVNSQGVIGAENKGGLLRTLTAANPSFETILGGLDDAAVLSGLYFNGDRFWSIDSRNNFLMTFSDTVILPVYPSLPADKLTGVATEVNLDWYAVVGFTEYEWQVCDHASFSNIAPGFSGSGAAAGTRVSALAPGTTYYWRARATKPVRSPWSDTRSFTTLLGGTNAGPALDQPANGVTTDLKPIFRWGTVTGADRYELVVSKDANFTSTVFSFTGSQALTSNAWQCDIYLDYDSAYFWKVRACTATNFGPWSPVNAFITGDAPVPAVTPATANAPIIIQMPEQPPVVLPTQQINIIAPENPTPVYSPTNIVEFNIPEWAIIAALGFLAAIVLLLGALILAVLKTRRL